MKIHKKIFLIIITFALFTLIYCSRVYAEGLSGLEGVQSIMGMSSESVGQMITLKYSDMNTYENKNLYCISYHNKNNSENTQYKVLTYIEINNGVATAVDENGTHNGWYHVSNVVLADILSGAYGETGYGTQDNYTDTQKALYCFWNKWLLDCGKNGGLGTYDGWPSDHLIEGETGDTGGNIINKAGQTAGEKANGLSAKIYLLRDWEGKGKNWQRLMIAQVNSTEEDDDEPSSSLDYDGYIKIKGRVWLDGDAGKGNNMNGYYDSTDTNLEGIKVILCDKSGYQFDDGSTAITGADGTYEIKVNLDRNPHVYKLYDENGAVHAKLMDGAYVKFEYNGFLYTTVNYKELNVDNKQTSRGKENEGNRDAADTALAIDNSSTHSNNSYTVNAETKEVINFNTYKYKKVKPETVVTTWCFGDSANNRTFSKAEKLKGRTYEYTNPNGDWLDVLYRYNQDAHVTHIEEKSQTPPVYDDNGVEIKEYCWTDWCKTGHSANTKTVTNLIIYDVNLGLFKREQPDAALSSDIDRVEIVMNNQYYKYKYNNTVKTGIDSGKTEYDTDVKVAFQNKYTYVYRKEVNPADVAFANTHEGSFNVYVTYKIKVKNQSNTLRMVIDKIHTTYDIAYTICKLKIDKENGYTCVETKDGSWGGPYNNPNRDKVKKAVSNNLNLVLEAQEEKTIEITYRISNDVVQKQLLSRDATLSNAFEIYQCTTQYGKDTLYAEQRTGGRTGKAYAGRDLDSCPGNAVIGTKAVELLVDSYKDDKGNIVEEKKKEDILYVKEKLEDDTDIAPSFILKLKKYYKTISGNVYEDIQTKESDKENERTGNGNKDKGEFGVANVKVELIRTYTGEVAQLYHVNRVGKAPDVEQKSEDRYSTIKAVTYTDENGNYSFGNNDTYGLAVDQYYIRFTYGNNEQEYVTTDENGNRITVGGIGADKVSAIEGNNINARNYKSTIVNNDPIESIMKGNKVENSNKWHLLEGVKGTTIAVDDIKKRYYTTDSTSLIYENFEQTFNMEASSEPFELQVEYTINPFTNIDTTGVSNVDNKKNCDVFDFGIIERAREDLVIDKSISRLKLTLANGQILIDGVPGSEKLDYTKAVGINKEGTGKERNQRQKLITIEMDTEYIQGATLEIWYKITASNNSEKDYEYKYNNKYKTNYYYFGEKFDDIKLVQKSIEKVVDYLDPELICIIPDELDESGSPNQKNKEYKWKTISAEDLINGGYISEKTKETLESKKYLAVYTDIFGEQNIPTETSYTAELYVSKLLANKDDELVFENHTEIAQINGTTARTIEKIETTGKKDNKTRTQYKKTYKSGDYIPSASWTSSYYTLMNFTIPDKGNETTGQHEQDDDMVKIVITPPTGLNSNIIMFIIITAIILTSVGVWGYLKKKVLK